MFLYFKESYKWSLAVALAIDSIAGQGAEFGEINWACSRLTKACETEDAEAWHAVWLELAERVDRLGNRAMHEADYVDGHRAQLRACTYYQMAERFLRPQDERKRAVFRRSVNCFQMAWKIFSTSVERVEIPFEDSYLSAIFVRPMQAAKAPFPVVIFYGGLESTKEQLFFHGGRQLAEFGLGVLIVDGPGNGESLRFQGHRSRFDYEVPTCAVVDWLTARPDVDGRRIGLLAVSMGGYYAARSAAFEPRLAAAAAWGAIWDYQAIWLNRRNADHEHLNWVLGADHFDEALRILERFKLDGVAQRISIPFLILHGGADRQVPVSHATQFRDALGAKDKTLVVLDEEDFGNQHAQIDNLPMAHLYLFPWMHKRLVRADNYISRMAP